MITVWIILKAIFIITTKYLPIYGFKEKQTV